MWDLNCVDVVYIYHISLAQKFMFYPDFHLVVVVVYLFHGNAKCLKLYQTSIYFQALDRCNFLIDPMKGKLVTPE